MPVLLPVITSKNNYRLSCPIDDTQYLFDIRWNTRDAAWYIDVYESDDTVIALNIKIVIGIRLGFTSQHDFFQNHFMTAYDTTGKGVDPGFDDLGSRVVISIMSLDDVFS